MNRRGFLQSILAACAAPAIVRAESLMVGTGFVIPAREIILPGALIVPKSALRVGRVLTVSANSLPFLEAQAEGLIEMRRFTSWRGGELVDFALERPELREDRRLIL